MSFAPRDSHEAQVQFALERGVPAVIGVLGTIKMPYPSSAFDMAHCSRCLIPWFANGENCTLVFLNLVCVLHSLNTSFIQLYMWVFSLIADGMYMKEVDRVLRPGGYWVLSGPPINWKTNFKAWQRPREELEEEQRKIEETAKLLCWEKVSEKAEIAVWRKRVDADTCRAEQGNTEAAFCQDADPDDVWYASLLIYSFTPNHLWDAFHGSKMHTVVELCFQLVF